MPYGVRAFGQVSPFSDKCAPRALLLVERESISPQPLGLLAGLSAEERDVVFALCKRRLLRRHEILFEQGHPNEGIYLIQSGLIRVYCLASSGREITRGVWYPGNFVGGPEIFGRGRHVWSARAVRRSEVFFLRGADLRRLVTQMPNLALNVIENLIFKSKTYSALIQILCTRPAEERLELLLDHLAELYGTHTDDGVCIGRTLTHADLAHLVGTRRQWVTAALKRLERAGTLTIRETYLVWRNGSQTRSSHPIGNTA